MVLMLYNNLKLSFFGLFVIETYCKSNNSLENIALISALIYKSQKTVGASTSRI